jgi:membrane protein DedA with SNARE-associated domain
MQELLDPFIPWLNQYGSFAIFGLLALGIVALPVPEESLLVFAGFLMAKGNLPVPQTILAAITGAWCGITTSYLIGLGTGTYLSKKSGKYRHYLGLTDVRLEKAHRWFEKYGKWSLFIGYFIMGVRHFTGYIAGTLRLEYRTFAWVAYSGGFFWASLFLSIGYFFSAEWENAMQFLHSHLVSFLNFF